MTTHSVAPDKFERIDLGLDGVSLLRPRVFRDTRGYFFESYHETWIEQVGIRERFVQDNQSQSVQHTLRGLHYQLRNPQAKLCRVIVGEVLDVAIDVRVGSPTFGIWTSATLSEKNHLQIYIPAGFAHGFLVLSEVAVFLYKCSAFYDPADDCGIRWNDPALGIKWGIETPILSAKDGALPLMNDLPTNLLPRYGEPR